MSARELCAAAELSTAAVSQLEHAVCDGIELATIAAVADALGVRRAWLAYGDGKP